MLSSRRVRGRLVVRMHHMFLDADPAVLRALGRYLAGGDASSSSLIDEFIERHRGSIRDQRRAVVLRTRGECHDLAVIERDLRARCFPDVPPCRITWGRRTRRRRRRSIQLGTYVPDEQLIRIHPVLDQAWVPRFYVEAVVFHELLHHQLKGTTINGRTHFHTPEFRAREAAFEHHERATAWEKANLRRLLRGG